MKKFTALLLAALMLCGILAGCGGSGGSSAIPTFPSNPTTEPTTEATVNPEYEEIFTSRFIVDMPPFFLMLDSAAFAMVSEETGMVEKMEYGYKDDVVKEMINTIYYPISEMTDDQKTQLDTSLKEALAGYTELSFCDSSFEIGNSYYIVKLHYTELDTAANVQALQGLGIVTGDASTGLISMEQSESSLIANGYIKR